MICCDWELNLGLSGSNVVDATTRRENNLRLFANSFFHKIKNGKMTRNRSSVLYILVVWSMWRLLELKLENCIL